MGANFDYMALNGKLSHAEIRKAFDHHQVRDRHENGHSYSGGLGMAKGLVFSSKTFTSSETAYAWLEDNAEKWGPAICVRVEPDLYLIGALCSC